MFKKLINLSCCLAAVLAEKETKTFGDIKTTEGTAVTLAEAKDGSVTNYGVIGESFVEQGDDQALLLYIGWTTASSSSIKNGSWI